MENAILEQDIKFLDLKYSDLTGRLRHVTLPVEQLEHAVKEGVGFDSSAVAGFQSKARMPSGALQPTKTRCRRVEA